MTVRADTLAALDGEWRSTSQIQRRIGMWALRSVGHELNDLANAGTIERKTERMPSWTVSLYRLKPETSNG